MFSLDCTLALGMSDWCSGPIVGIVAALGDGLALQLRSSTSLVEASGRELKDPRQCDAMFGEIFEATRLRDGTADILFKFSIVDASRFQVQDVG